MSNPVGRPKKEFNWDEFDKLCAFHCTLPEIAAWFGVSEDTVERRCKEKHGVNFAVINKQKAGLGNISLRRKQMQVALSGSVPMLIFLGKQWLGQKDRLEHSGDPDRPPAITLNYKIDEAPDDSKSGD